jgi:hypothetical protein
MPNIHIASVYSPGINLRQEDFDVAIIEDHNLKSERSHFNEFWNSRNGTMIHIGNPDLREIKDNFFFAGEIIDWEFEPVDMLYFPSFDEEYTTCEGGANQQVRFQFLDQYRKDIDRLLRAALNSSPVKKGCLLSDYWYGPDKEHTEVISKISDLWSLHDSEGLTFNTMYEFYSS